jgi:hypothetical protein
MCNQSENISILHSLYKWPIRSPSSPLLMQLTNQEGFCLHSKWYQPIGSQFSPLLRSINYPPPLYLIGIQQLSPLKFNPPIESQHSPLSMRSANREDYFPLFWWDQPISALFATEEWGNLNCYSLCLQ